MSNRRPPRWEASGIAQCLSFGHESTLATDPFAPLARRDMGEGESAELWKDGFLRIPIGPGLTAPVCPECVCVCVQWQQSEIWEGSPRDSSPQLGSQVFVGGQAGSSDSG